MYMKYCSRCKKRFSMHRFIKTNNTYSPMCPKCRGEDETFLIHPVYYMFVSVPSDKLMSCFSFMQAYNCNSAILISCKVMSVFDTDSLPDQDTSSQRRLKVSCEQNFRKEIQQIEWYLREENGRSKSRAKFRCKQTIKGNVYIVEERPSQMIVVEKMR